MKRKHRDNSIDDEILEKNSVFINNKVLKSLKMFYLFKVCTEFITCCKSSKQKSWERQTWGCLHASQTLGSDNK